MSAPTLYFTAYAHRAIPRRLRLGRWLWEVRDGATGPTLASGHTLTEWGAYRRRNKVAAGCQLRHHIVDISHPPLHPLAAAEVDAIAAGLAAEGVRVRAWLDADSGVHLAPLGPCETWREVRALSAFRCATDARLAWHRTVAR